MFIESGSNVEQEGKVDLLSLIDRNQTNIENIKILTHYEHINDKNLRFHNITNKINDFLKNIAEKDYTIFDAMISNRGEISNFKFRFKDKMQILNEINCLNYITADVPREFKNSFKISDGHIYIIRYFNFEKIEINEEEVEQIIDDGELVINENDKFIFLQKNYKNSIESYWTENPLKAIFKLKKDGFYLGANSPDINENIEIINSFIDEPEIILFTNQKIIINGMTVNGAEILKVKIPFKISEIIKKRFVKREKFIPRQKSVAQLYKTKEEQNFEIDNIDPKIDKIKLPRRAK